jgi:peptidoglycan/LPS O-acetylase OafA/YrhL
MPNADATPPQPNHPPIGRYVFLDGLRGIACLIVFAYHIQMEQLFSGAIAPHVPRSIQQLIAHGNLGVQIFFVLSGFVIAHSQRNARVNAAYLGNFALRRALRLDPAYWAALALAISFSVSPWGKWFPGLYIPTLKQIFINMFYLQEFLKSHRLVGASWTLCYEVQFYLVLTILTGAAQSLARRARWAQWRPLLVLSMAIGVVSLLVTGGAISPVPGLFTNLWFMFYLGVLACWSLQRRISFAWFWIYSALTTITLLHGWNAETVMALATAIVILTVGYAEKLNTWLGNPIIQFFGRISYSIYLLHGIICIYLLEAGRKITGTAALPALGWISLALGITFAASWFLYRFVERPGVVLGNRLKQRSARINYGALASTP